MKKFRNILIILIVVFLGVNTVHAHPYYVTLCRIDFNPESQTLEITLKIFADDLLTGLESVSDAQIFLGEAKENPDTDALVYKLMQEHLSFAVNKVPVNYDFIGKESDRDVVWIYLESENVSSMHSLQIHCDLLVDLYESQSNIIQVHNHSDDIKNILLNKDKTTGMIEF